LSGLLPFRELVGLLGRRESVHLKVDTDAGQYRHTRNADILHWAILRQKPTIPEFERWKIYFDSDCLATVIGWTVFTADKYSFEKQKVWVAHLFCALTVPARFVRPPPPPPSSLTTVTCLKLLVSWHQHIYLRVCIVIQFLCLN
jgi:hypothetical protein